MLLASAAMAGIFVIGIYGLLGVSAQESEEMRSFRARGASPDAGSSLDAPR
jgi:hypothetical protein